jgi:MFS family permease
MTAIHDKNKVLGLYRGWWATVAAFFMAFFAWGTIFYGNGFYIRVLSQEHGWSVASLSVAVGFSYFVGIPATLAIGRVIDRVGTRWVAVTGALLLASGITALAHVQAIWQVAAAYIMIGVGYPCMATITVSSTLIPWFQRRLGLALGLALTGASIGGMSIVPVMALVTERYDFATAASGTSLAILAITLPLVLLMVRQPRNGEVMKTEVVTPKFADDETQNVSYGQFLRNLNFWRITIGSSLALAAQVGFLTHQIPALEESLDITAAAFAVSITAGSAIIGRFALGWSASRAPLYLLAIICYGLQAIALVLIAQGGGLFYLYAASAIGGVVVGAIVMLPPLLLSDAFGSQVYGTAYGLTNIGMYLSVTLAVAAAGYLRDLQGDYVVVFYTLAALHLVAMAVMVLGRRKG